MPPADDNPTEPGTIDPDATRGPDTARPAGPCAAPPGYEIERELGRGGMGVVYLARDVRLGRRCALKVVLAGVHADAAEVDRYQAEARAIARLQHPGIVQIFEVGEHAGLPFLALEYCDGGSLDAVLMKSPLPPREAAGLVRALAEAIQAAHAANVLHRDLKPANVLLTGDGTPKVADFGLAKRLDEAGRTRTGAILGTPSYMPPEQAEGRKDVGPTADVYALGAILYECLAGRPPFRAATAMDTLLQVLTTDPVPLRQLNARLPRDLETICHRCLHKDPNKRYASAKELADDLGRFLAGRPIHARPVGVLERGYRWVRRNPAVASLALLAGLAVLAGLVASWALAGWALHEKGKADERAGTEALAKRQAQAAERKAGEQLRRAELLAYAGRLALAQGAFADGKGSRALAHLGECQWDLRGWEHRHLWTHSTSRQTFRRGDASYAVECVAWSPDGRRILTGSGDKTAAIRDAATGRELVALHGHTGAVVAVAWRPDGKRLVTGSWDETATVFDAETGRAVVHLRGHLDNVIGVAWSPDGRRVLTGSDDGTATIWNAETGEALVSLTGHELMLYGVAWSPDGARVATGGFDDTARVWDATSGEELTQLEGHASTVRAVAWSPDGRHVLTGSDDNTARAWDAASGGELVAIVGHTNSVTSVAWSPDGRHALTGSEDGTARVWDGRTGRERAVLPAHAGVTGVAWSPDGRRVATCGRDQTVQVWAALSGHGSFALPGQDEAATSVAWSPDGWRVLVGGDGRQGEAKVLDARTGLVILTLRGHADTVGCVAWGPADQLLTGSRDGTAKIWDAATGQVRLTLRGHESWVAGVAWAPDGKRVLTAGWDRTARVWDAADGRELAALQGDVEAQISAAWDPDGRRVLTAGNSTTRIWDAATGRVHVALRAEGEAVAWSPDGRRVVTGDRNRVARVWDAETGRELLALRGHDDWVVGVAWSPDGQRIVTAGRDDTLRVWHASSGQELATLKARGEGLLGVAWSPDGGRLVTGGRTARVWLADRQPPHVSPVGQHDLIDCVAWSPDGRRLVTGGRFRVVRVWDAVKGHEILALPGHTEMVTDAAWSPDGGRILTVGVDRTARLWDGDSGEALLVLTADEPLARGYFAPDGARIFAQTEGGKILAWDAATGAAARVADPPAPPPPGPARSPDGFRTATPLGHTLAVADARVPPVDDAWPLPDAADRKAYHAVEAALAEKEGRWFAVAFHVGRLLLDAPNDADFKKRRDDALKKHAGR